MTGKICKVPLDDSDEGHPHVIVLEIGGQYIGVPGLSVGGSAVEQQIADAKIYFRPASDDQMYAQMDSAKFVTWRDSREQHDAYWLFFKFSRIDKSSIGPIIGQMGDEGVIEIIDGLLRFADLQPDRFSRPLLKRLRQLRKKYD